MQIFNHCWMWQPSVWLLHFIMLKERLTKIQYNQNQNTIKQKSFTWMFLSTDWHLDLDIADVVPVCLKVSCCVCSWWCSSERVQPRMTRLHTSLLKYDGKITSGNKSCLMCHLVSYWVINLYFSLNLVKFYPEWFLKIPLSLMQFNYWYG